jgi:hypothetical protein
VSPIPVAAAIVGHARRYSPQMTHDQKNTDKSTGQMGA